MHTLLLSLYASTAPWRQKLAFVPKLKNFMFWLLPGPPLTRWKVLGIRTITMCAKVTQAHHAPRLPWLPQEGILVPEKTHSGNYVHSCPSTPGRGAPQTQPLTTAHVRCLRLISGCMVTQQHACTNNPPFSGLNIVPLRGRAGEP